MNTAYKPTALSVAVREILDVRAFPRYLRPYMSTQNGVIFGCNLPQDDGWAYRLQVRREAESDIYSVAYFRLRGPDLEWLFTQEGVTYDIVNESVAMALATPKF